MWHTLCVEETELEQLLADVAVLRRPSLLARAGVLHHPLHLLAQLPLAVRVRARGRVHKAVHDTLHAVLFGLGCSRLGAVA